MLVLSESPRRRIDLVETVIRWPSRHLPARSRRHSDCPYPAGIKVASAAMPPPATATTPSIDGLFPAILIGGVGHSAERARRALGLGEEQLHPAQDNSLQADIELPRGTWRIWPERAVAAWLGRDAATVPRTLADVAPVPIDLVCALRRLHCHGLWCVEARLLTHQGWSRPSDSHTSLEDLVRRPDQILALSGVFAGGDTGPARVEISRDGRVWASDPLDAERWLLVAHGMRDVL
jgi:hypothetical protein